MIDDHLINQRCSLAQGSVMFPKSSLKDSASFPTPRSFLAKSWGIWARLQGRAELCCFPSSAEEFCPSSFPSVLRPHHTPFPLGLQNTFLFISGDFLPLYFHAYLRSINCDNEIWKILSPEHLKKLGLISYAVVLRACNCPAPSS